MSEISLLGKAVKGKYVDFDDAIDLCGNGKIHLFALRKGATLIFDAREFKENEICSKDFYVFNFEDERRARKVFTKAMKIAFHFDFVFFPLKLYVKYICVKYKLESKENNRTIYGKRYRILFIF